MVQPAIRTPDQRLRVFVSSTLHELAAERAQVRRSVEQLHLTPVMFEAGARAHPPRDLYRAYLAQSDVFVGIYGSSYGWCAPDMAISGIEDEFVLSEGKPRLVYVKADVERDPRLAELIARLERAEELAYRPYRDPEELHALVASDLALLLTERFAASAPGPTEAADHAWAVPDDADELVGRDELAERVARSVLTNRITTLTGPGGTGKTTLARVTARRLAADFADGTYYVALAPLARADEVAEHVCATLGLRDAAAARDPVAVVSAFFRARRALLVLDNFEHVLDAATAASAWTAAARELRVLATSREALHLRGEAEIAIPPLAVADPTGDLAPAVRLFELRARSIRPSFTVDASNRAAVTAICRRLDGLPLAIELAAARVKLLGPDALLARLDQALPLLTSGARDLPERHRTLHGLFDWSYRLLEPEEQRAFARLGVLRGHFGLDLAEAVIGDGDGDPLDTVTSLVDKSLIERLEVGAELRFQLLETAREFALAQLTPPEAHAARQAQAHWAAAQGEVLLDALTDDDPSRWRLQFDLEEPQLLAGLQHASGPTGDPDVAAMLFAFIGLPYMSSARVRDVLRAWEVVAPAVDRAVAPAARAMAHVVRGAAAASLSDTRTATELLPGAIEDLRERHPQFAAWGDVMLAMALFGAGEVDEATARATEAARRAESATMVGAALMILTLITLMTGDIEGATRHADQLEIESAKLTSGDMRVNAVGTAGRVALARGELEVAREKLARAVALSHESGSVWGGINALQALASVAVAEGRLEDAAGMLEQAIRWGRHAGMQPGLEMVVGALAGLALRAGDRTSAAALVRVVRPTLTQEPVDPDLRFGDPTGGLRQLVDEALALREPNPREAPVDDRLVDEVLAIALGEVSG